MDGIKHLIECHCILPQYRTAKNPVYHKFVVFSIIDDSDTTIPKYVKCNNCGVVHKIYDICRSEIAYGKDELNSIMEKKDIKISLPPDICDILETYDVDLATYENAKFILDEELWGTKLTLNKEIMEDEETGKILIFASKDKFKIETFIRKLMLK